MSALTERHKELYHYTDWNGVCGIVSSQCFHATHIRFQNDQSEYIHAREKIVEMLVPKVVSELDLLTKSDTAQAENIASKGGSTEVAKTLSKSLIDTLYDIVGSHIYIVSFSGKPPNTYVQKNGLLSQWRGYGASQGFALVFATEDLESMLQTEYASFAYEAGFFQDAVYGSDDELFDTDIVQNVKKFADSIAGRLRHLSITKTLSPETFPIVEFCQVATALKHVGFQEENEVRMVFLPYNTHHRRWIHTQGGEPPVHQRERKHERLKPQGNYAKPYIELLGPKIGKLPLKRVIVGPGANNQRAAHALRVLLDDENVHIDVSETPFDSRPV
jgi:hypothetical protein